MKTKDIFFHEVNVGDTVTHNLIYPKSFKVESKEHVPGQCRLKINGNGYAAYGSAKIILDS